MICLPIHLRFLRAKEHSQQSRRKGLKTGGNAHRVWKGLGADSEEKREPASAIEPAVVKSLKALDPNRPIREADIVEPTQLRIIGPRLGGKTRF